MNEQSGVPSRRELARYDVNRPGWEAIRQSLYDFQAYAAAGQQQLTFFAVPVGQGGKTLSDTNMTLASQLPQNQEFLIESIEVVFFPTTPTVAAAMPAANGVPAVAVQVNDSYVVSRTGNLQLQIGSKDYLREAPLGKFPSKTHLEVIAEVGDATGVAATTTESRIVMPYWAGRPYLLSPVPIRLVSSQNFGVFLNWPEGNQAITNPARIGVILDGILYRRSQ